MHNNLFAALLEALLKATELDFSYFVKRLLQQNLCETFSFLGMSHRTIVVLATRVGIKLRDKLQLNLPGAIAGP